MALNQDFKEFLELLNKHEVKYLVVGGYSVAIHGHPRYTKDIDIWILASEENASSLMDTLEEFGFGSLDLNAEDFKTPGQVVQLGNAPARIDILTSLTGVDFDTCWENRVSVEDDGLVYPVISLVDLRVNKTALGRHQDLADLEQLGDE
jgi:sugar phosphate isomerase/epimerase